MVELPSSFRRHQKLSYCSCKAVNDLNLNTKFWQLNYDMALEKRLELVA
jgi:hypothetical protein